MKPGAWSIVGVMGLCAGCATPSARLTTGSESPLAQLQTLVEINSGTTNTAGVDRVQTWLSGRLRALGFSVTIDNQRLLIATRAGAGSASPVTLIVHADTVFEPTSPFQTFRLSEDRKTATGPGVIDDKGGMIVALSGLSKYLAGNAAPIALRVVSSPNEETGSPGNTETFRRLAMDSAQVLGFEPALENGALIASRRGNRWYHIEVKGKEAHSGRAHREGVNACLVLAEELTELSKLTDYDRDVTVSIGHMEGGQDKYNIVCGSAQAKLDTRFATLADREALAQRVLAILGRTWFPSAQTHFELADDCPPFSGSAASAPDIESYRHLIGEIEGTPVGAGKSGGAADTNYFSREGAVVIDGLGPVGGKMHTTDEYLVVSSLETRALALSRYLKSLEATHR